MVDINILLNRMKKADFRTEYLKSEDIRLKPKVNKSSLTPKQARIRQLKRGFNGTN